MKCNKEECKYCKLFENSKDCGLCLCSFNDDYLQVEYNGDCIYSPKKLTCKDCTRFGTDFACMTAEADDPVNNCIGFIDDTETKICNILYDKFIKGYSKEQINNILNNVIKFVAEEFKVPYDKEEK